MPIIILTYVSLFLSVPQNIRDKTLISRVPILPSVNTGRLKFNIFRAINIQLYEL